ncbi:MAG: PAS domain-containing protein [Armatimonadota bacterium]
MAGPSQARVVNRYRESFLADYGGHMARLLVLFACFAGGWLLNHIAAGRPYFGLLLLTGVITVCIGLVLGPGPHKASTRLAVALFDLAWIMFAMYLTDGLSSFLLPLLYIVVATAAMRGRSWEIGTTVAGAITGVFILASTNVTGTSLMMAVAQSTLLAAGALAVRLSASARGLQSATNENHALYESLLQMTSDAVFSLDPETWEITEANPAAAALFGGAAGRDLRGRPLPEIIRFKDHSFPQACRHKLNQGEEVRDAVTYARNSDGEDLMLRFSLSPGGDGDGAAVQAMVEIAEEQDVVVRPAPLPRDDFSVNYIPSLTHELNNHLAAIRLAAELAAATGRPPDLEEIQRQVDHCQDVLQTVVLQILRAAAPVAVNGETPSCDLRVVVERCLLLTRPQILTSGIHFEVDLPPDLPSVAGFAHELQEALVRVVIRSVKMMALQEAPRQLTITVASQSRAVELLFTDSTEGLGTRELAVINGRMAGVARAEDRGWEVVRDATCRFGGTVQASNGLNGGMRLKITLPVIREQVTATA